MIRITGPARGFLLREKARQRLQVTERWSAMRRRKDLAQEKDRGQKPEKNRDRERMPQKNREPVSKHPGAMLCRPEKHKMPHRQEQRKLQHLMEQRKLPSRQVKSTGKNGTGSGIT